jgi:hypothetical protein
VAFEIARPVFTLTVRLVDRLAVDLSTLSTSALVMCVDIIDVDDQAGIRYIDGARRVEMMRSMDASRNEPEWRTRKSSAAVMSW